MWVVVLDATFGMAPLAFPAGLPASAVMPRSFLLWLPPAVYDPKRQIMSTKPARHMTNPY